MAPGLHGQDGCLARRLVVGDAKNAQEPVEESPMVVKNVKEIMKKLWHATSKSVQVRIHSPVCL